MDQKKFQELIQGFGQLETIESSEAGAKRSKDNGSLPVRFRSLNDRIAVCEDCGCMAVNRRVAIQKLNDGLIKTTCSHCKLCRHPDTGKFDIPSRDFSHKARYFKKKS